METTYLLRKKCYQSTKWKINIPIVTVNYKLKYDKNLT
jgi:hypothetical protein